MARTLTAAAMVTTVVATAGTTVVLLPRRPAHGRRQGVRHLSAAGRPRHQSTPGAPRGSKELVGSTRWQAWGMQAWACGHSVEDAVSVSCILRSYGTRG